MTEAHSSTDSEQPVSIVVPHRIMKVCKQFAQELTDQQRQRGVSLTIDGQPANDREMASFYDGFRSGALAGVLYALTLGSEGKMGDIHEAPIASS